MNFAAIFRAVDTAFAFYDAAKKVRGPAAGPAQPDRPVARAESLAAQAAPPPAMGGQLEARLTGVVVAALKEAFDRDHARLELERQHLDDQRKRAEEAMKMELRRQAADRELNRLRLLGGTALVGWIASVLLFVVRAADATDIARAMTGGGWLLLLGALAAAFSAQRRVSASVVAGEPSIDAGSSALWLLVAGLGLGAASLLF